MIRMILASLIFLGISSHGHAISSPQSSAVGSALEVLNLPSENRRIVIQGQGDKHYQNFIAVAFDDKQTMSLRWRALMAAAEARGAGATSDLLKASKHKDWYMRNAALIALTEVNPEQSEKLAIELLKDKALVVRSAAVQSLDRSTSPMVRDLLWEELNQNYNFKNAQSLWIRHQIVEVLAKKPEDREVKIFAGLLKDKDARVQSPAIRGLEKITGVVLGEGKVSGTSMVGLWQDYVKKEKLEL